VTIFHLNIASSNSAEVAFNTASLVVWQRLQSHEVAANFPRVQAVTGRSTEAETRYRWPSVNLVAMGQVDDVINFIWQQFATE
jgi:hypothetical protein